MDQHDQSECTTVVGPRAAAGPPEAVVLVAPCVGIAHIAYSNLGARNLRAFLDLPRWLLHCRGLPAVALGA